MHDRQCLCERTVHVGILIVYRLVHRSLTGLPARYVTQYGNVDIWWTGSRLNQIASPLPPVGDPVNGTAIVPYRYATVQMPRIRASTIDDVYAGTTSTP